MPIFLVLDASFAASPRAAAAELTGYVTGWAAYALATLPVCRSIGREMHWPRLVAAWNWTNLLQYLIMLVIAVVSALPSPGWLREVVTVSGIGYALWLQWFAARSTLRVSSLAAAGFVVLDLTVTVLISGAVTDLSRG
ncbi:hypothetical protein E0493_11360 [Roseomonas sp. M0104]|uniref:Uncharacterized protein n=1 Tax=Teichococcus coralli TaxID=2545983 RepID=A0A845BFB9_9PROT|nr:hypothetical protein [Pseudoroseomonas coralli]MXP63942.1 hypothetical protein [Pseudoroseomonas coralli]